MSFFITPSGRVIGDTTETVELIGPARLKDAERGTLALWQEAVRAAVEAENTPHWTLGAATGFAAAVSTLAGFDTCGINLSGPSSLGKTTALKLAVSPWSSPRINAGLLRSMLSTENALEVLAVQSFGTILALDELAHAPGRMVGRIVYMLAGGAGKSRMRADGGLRPAAVWSTFVLTSGEHALEQKVREDAGQWSSGMAARFTNVDVSPVNPKIGRATFDQIEAINRHHGHAGPVFVERLVGEGWHRDPEPLRRRIIKEAEALAGPDADGVRIRAALPLAIVAVAGAAAVAFGVLPQTADVAGAVAWAWGRFTSSRDATALDVESRAIDNLRLWIAERWDGTIRDVAAPRSGASREVLAWFDTTSIYVPTARVAEAAGNTLSAQAIGAMLDRKDLLARRTNPRRIALKRVPQVGQIACYALRRDAFGRP